VNGLIDRVYTWLRIRALRFAMSEGQSYNYMVRTLQSDSRLPTARIVDTVVRKDAVERRIEADWLKRLAKLVKDEGTGE
jgi:hypothetical protein